MTAYGNVSPLTLNQRVQGSSPCAPTIEFKDLAENKVGVPRACPHRVRKIVVTATSALADWRTLGVLDRTGEGSRRTV